jgi:hypothetical protein
LQASIPYTSASHTALYIGKLSGTAVLNFLGTKNFVIGDGDPFNYVTTFNIPNVYQTRRTPATRGPGEIPLSIDLQAYATGAAEPITITNTVS